MRALYLPDLVIQEEYSVREEPLHHLVNVARVEMNEGLLLLNGKGLLVETTVSSVSKKELRLTKTREIVKSRAFEFDLALAMPKREALELSLKEATELGFRNIFLIKSDYSQMKFPEEERTQKLLISALEQSNGGFLPKVLTSNWENLSWKEYDACLLLDSQTKENNKKASREGKVLLIVGPEGGFSPRELEYLHSLENLAVLNLPTPILRTPTAVAAGAGILLERLLK